MKNEEMINVLKSGWQETRQLTEDLINQLSLEMLNKKLPRPGLDSFAKHFFEMAMVQRAFTDVINDKPLDFSSVERITFQPVDYKIEGKKELIDLLKKSDEYYYATIDKTRDWDKSVEMFGAKRSKWSILEVVIRHETIHHGQLAAYMYLFRLNLPQSWVDAWAFPVNSPIG